MKVKLGDLVASEFGKGRIVAMSNQWCIHSILIGTKTEEIAVEWDCVWIPVEVEGEPQSQFSEKEFNS